MPSYSWERAALNKNPISQPPLQRDWPEDQSATPSPGDEDDCHSLICQSKEMRGPQDGSLSYCKGEEHPPFRNNRLKPGMMLCTCDPHYSGSKAGGLREPKSLRQHRKKTCLKRGASRRGEEQKRKEFKKKKTHLPYNKYVLFMPFVCLGLFVTADHLN